MSNVRHDDIERDSKLSALYPLAGSDGPSPALDAAISAAAHRAVGARPRLAGSPFSRSWRVPLSIAAVVVVSVSVVILMREESPEVAQLTPAPVAGSPSKPDSGANELPKPASPPVAADSGVSPKPPQKAVPPAADRPAASEPLAKRRAAPEAFPGATGARDADRAKPGRLAPKEQARSDVAAASKEARLKAAQAEPARPAEGKVQSLDVQSASTVAGGMQGAASAAKKESTAAAAGKDEEYRDAQRARTPAPAAAPAATLERQAAQSADNLLAQTSLPPAKWLERIEDLRKQGKLDEARASLAEFKKRYPEYPLPETLKDGIRP